MSDSEENSRIESELSDEELSEREDQDEAQTEETGEAEKKVKKRKLKKKAPIVTKKRRLEDIKIHKEKKITLSDLESDDEDDDGEEKPKVPALHPEEVEHKSGVLYIQTIPPMFTPTRVREHMEKFGDLGRVYLACEKKRFGNDRKTRKVYTEGWVEFKKKKKAKQAALYLNNHPVGGKKRTMAAQTLWSVKYLKGFKWIHLVEQINYENKIDQHRMQAEISQAKRKASHFVEQLEKGENLKRAEEKVKKVGGVFETRPKRDIQQRQVFKPRKAQVKQTEEEKEDLMKMIYG